MRALLLIAFAGCYSPAAFLPCRTVCQSDEGCTPGFVCGTNGYCREPNAGNCSPTLDASTTGDSIVEFDGPPGSICFGSGFIKNFCFLPTEIPTTPLVLPSSFDTGGGECSKLLPQAGLGAPEICVMTGLSFTLPSVLRVVGTRPLAIITTMGIAISGTLDASSGASDRGPGSPASGITTCGVAGFGESTVLTGQGGGGGGAGSLRTSGGSGGTGTGGHIGGMGAVAKEVLFVRGGCDGAQGGSASSSAGGMAGFGGGAVYLLTNGTLSISGNINASGSGGGAPDARGGGGGGGSGGFIGLDANVFNISSSARIFASGGAGASGGGATSSGTSGGIADPMSDPSFTIGIGGGGTGGGGSSTTTGEIGEEGVDGGGGGGGGGAGFVGYAGPYPMQSTQIVRPKANTM